MSLLGNKGVYPCECKGEDEECRDCWGSGWRDATDEEIKFARLLEEVEIENWKEWAAEEKMDAQRER